MINIRVPLMIVSLAVAVIGLASTCGPGQPVNPCPSGGCIVNPEPTQEANSAFELSNCRDTGDKGPCAVWWPDVEGVCRWWYVPMSQVFGDGTQLDLGVSDEGVECQRVTRLPVPPWAEGPVT
jgi:hypothetical protein